VSFLFGIEVDKWRLKKEMVALQSICSDCYFKKVCILNSNKEFVQYCSEYLPIQTFHHAELNKVLTTKKLPQQENLGICKNCDNKFNCSLRVDHEIKFQCEEYK
jgi:hypothetical protein